MRRRRFIAFAGALVGVAAVSPVFAKPASPPSHPDRSRAGGGPLRARAIRGTISAISGQVWTVDTPRQGPLNIDVSKATVRSPRALASSMSQFQVGDEVIVRLAPGPSATSSGSTTLAAVAVALVPRGLFRHHVGTATGPVTNGTLTIQAKDGTRSTFTLTATTRIMAGKTPAGADAIQTGTLVTVITGADATTARGIVIHPAAST
jgi:hypothetical protein